MDETIKNKITIIVNGTPHGEISDFITYEKIVLIAFPEFAQNPEMTFSVTYQAGHSTKPEGILSPGGTVKIKDKMIFYVKHTGQS